MTGDATTQEQGGHRLTIDSLFRRAAVRNPDAPALVDPGNRASFTDGEPLRLTFEQTDRIVWAIAARLHALGLKNADVVAMQLPNTAESVLTLLGILRAGMVAALVPMLWRENEIVAALSSASAKAFITTARIAESDHCGIAMKVAAQLYSIRHVCAFGQSIPDGITPLDDLLTTRGFDVVATGIRGDSPAAQAAVITFAASTRGITAITRTHAQVIIGAMQVAAMCGLKPDTALLTGTPVSSLAGLCTALMPLLLSGQLVLHQPFDAAAFAEAIAARQPATVVLPGPVLHEFLARGLLGPTVANAIALWRAPERAETAAPTGEGPALVDLRVFGEIGFVATPRTTGGAIAPLTPGRAGGALELRRTETGTLAMRGAVAQTPPDAFIDTGYPCRIEPGNRLIISGPRPGLIGIGGYGVARSDLDALATILETDQLITPLPDALLGQRLAGSSPQRSDVEAVLTARGISPLIAGAFRPRRAA